MAVVGMAGVVDQLGVAVILDGGETDVTSVSYRGLC